MDREIDDATVGVQALAYLGMRSPAIDSWPDFAAILGAEATFADPDTVLVRLDERRQRLTIRRGDVDRIDFLGFELADAAALESARDLLVNHGHAVERLSPETLEARGCAAGIALVDPAGIRAEFVVPHRAPGGEPPQLGATFVTGDLGVGHVVLVVPDSTSYVSFFIDVLGFRVSDAKNEADGGMAATFLHCNPRHHSIAIVGRPATRGLHHLMVEVASLDAVGAAYDRATDAGVLFTTLGKHTNDHMVSFYVRTPSSFAIEYGFGGRLVDDATWVPESYEAASIWGHRLTGDRSVGAMETFAAVD